MSAYKKLNKQDIFITTYNAHKKWVIAGSDLGIYGINTYKVEGKFLNSIKQLYFPNFVTKEISSQNLQILSQSFDDYPQSTLTFSGSRPFSGDGYVISIPKELYGDNIHNDKSVRLEYTPSTYLESESDYWGYSYTVAPTVADGYVDLGYWAEGYAPYMKVSSNIVDDGEGNLYLEDTSPVQYVGYINYSHGLLYISNIFYDSIELSTFIFKSSQAIYTYNINCKLRDFEFNYTTNPSTYLRKQQTTYDSNGDLYQENANVFLGDIQSNITGSTFSPYITSVGLYNDANELIAVGKISRALPKSQDTETTIVVKLDI